MSKPAAFKATFSDFRLIKGRKVAQIIFELPIEGCDAALEALGGVPRPDRETWAAIARLDPKAVPEPSEPIQLGKRTFEELPFSQQAALRCQDMEFREFLRHECGSKAANAEEAAEEIRARCGVTSRKDLLPNTQAGNRWLLIESAYQAWKAA